MSVGNCRQLHTVYARTSCGMQSANLMYVLLDEFVNRPPLAACSEHS